MYSFFILLQDLQMIVAKEQEEYATYLKFAAKQCLQDYGHLNPDARKYVEVFLIIKFFKMYI